MIKQLNRLRQRLADWIAPDPNVARLEELTSLVTELGAKGRADLPEIVLISEAENLLFALNQLARKAPDLTPRVDEQRNALRSLLGIGI